MYYVFMGLIVIPILIYVMIYVIAVLGMILGQIYFHHRYGGLPVIERVQNFFDCKYRNEVNKDPHIRYQWDPRSGTHFTVESWDTL